MMNIDQNPIWSQSTPPHRFSNGKGLLVSLLLLLIFQWSLFAQDENLPPEARFVTFPAEPTLNQSITFAAAMSYDPDGTVVDFVWDFGDGQLGSGLQVEHPYAKPGAYLVTLIVVDAQGAEGIAMGEVVVAEPNERPLPPQITMEVHPILARANESLLFAASPLPEQGAERGQYFWDFGDRMFDETPLTEHVYQTPGEYRVALMVTDTEGEQASDFLAVSIVDDSEKIGLLEGLVFHDLNANGYRDEGEPGLGQWNVSYTGPDSGMLVTDPEGRFLQEVPLGTYQLSVTGREGWTFTDRATSEVPVPSGKPGIVNIAVQQQDATPPTPEEINPQDPPTLDPNIQCQCHCSASIAGPDQVDWAQLSQAVFTVRSKMDCAAWLQETGQSVGAGAVPWYNHVQWTVDQPGPVDPGQAITLKGNGAAVTAQFPPVGKQFGQQVTFTLRASFTAWGLCIDEETNTYNTVKFTCSASKKVTLSASCDDLVKDIARIQGEIMQLKRDIRDAEQQMARKQNKLNAGLQTLHKELAERRKQLAAFDRQLQSARQNLTHAENTFKSKGLDFAKLDSALKACRSGLGSARFALAKLVRPIRGKVFNQWILNQSSGTYRNVSSIQRDLLGSQSLSDDRLRALTQVVQDFLETVYPEKRDLIQVPEDLLNDLHVSEMYQLLTEHKLRTVTQIAPGLVQIGSLIQQMVPLPSGRARGLQALVEKTLETTVSAETSKAVVEIVHFITHQVLDVTKSKALQDTGVSEADLNSKDETTRDKKIKFLRSFIVGLSSKASTLTADLATAKREMDQARKARDEASAKVKKLENERADLLKSIVDLEQRRSTLKQTLQNEIDALQKQIDNLQQTLSKKVDELKRLMQLFKANRDKCPEVNIPAIPSELVSPRVALNASQKPMFHIYVQGSPLTTYTLEQSKDLRQWQATRDVTLDDLGEGVFTFQVPEDSSAIFYRAPSKVVRF